MESMVFIDHGKVIDVTYESKLDAYKSIVKWIRIVTSESQIRNRTRSHVSFNAITAINSSVSFLKWRQRARTDVRLENEVSLEAHDIREPDMLHMSTHEQSNVANKLGNQRSNGVIRDGKIVSTAVMQKKLFDCGTEKQWCNNYAVQTMTIHSRTFL
jgi:hypothetical protein